MARRRMLSEEILYDQHFNELSIEAQNLFVRMLTKADDCGVVPADEYPLNILINPPQKMKGRIPAILGEIVSQGLGTLVLYEGKKFFLFKSSSFDNHQKFILGRRTRSEYMKLRHDEFVSMKFHELQGSSGTDVHPTVKSNRQEAKSKEHDGQAKEARPSGLQAVQELFKVRQYPMGEAQKFWLYYEANGWRVGRNPMRDWKSASAGWVMRSKEYRTTNKASVPIEQPRQRSTYVCSLCNTQHRVSEPCPPKNSAMGLVNQLAQEKRVK